MTVFAIGTKVRVKQIDVGTIPYGELIGLEGRVVDNHDNYSFGPTLCAHISVEFEGRPGSTRFYSSELEAV